jgi:ABC-type transport system involved in multi-copper enzyme maturation permease subunit
MLDTARPAGTITEERSRQAQMYRKVMYLGFFDPNSRSGGIAAAPAMRITVALAIAVAAGTGALFWFTGVDYARDSISQTLLMILPGVAMGLVAVIGAGGVLWLLATLNPVTVKEQKTNRFGRSHWMIRLIGGCVIVSLGLMYATTLQSQAQITELGTLGGILVLLQVALIVLLTPTLASGLISVERESGGWELLQMTPLSATKIVGGKLISVVLTLLLLIAATLPGYLVLLAVDPGQLTRVVDVIITLGLIATMALFVSAAISSLCKRTAIATTLAYTVLIGLCAGTLLIWLGENAPFNPTLVENVLVVNPLATALSLIQAPGFAGYNLLPANWYVVLTICAAALGVLIVQTYRLTKPQ